MRSSVSRSRDVSTQSASISARRSHAAGDARPNGCRPRSYVEIRRTRTTPHIMVSAMATPAAAIPARADFQADTSFFGHPRGLATLFLTEMWERFSYYGMRAFLILYMAAPVSAGGLGFADKDAASIYGTYTGGVWGAAIVGGVIADRFLGQYRSVLFGGVLIALGHLTLAFKSIAFFYSGLGLIVLGTGLLKPNVSTLVGALYAEDDP